jgi:isocitrate/isopropylmalate dehydrogenase
MVNPIASMESIRMMLDHLGEEQAALDIQRAVVKTLTVGKVKTPDIGGTHKTYEVGDEIRKAILNK